ncbi:MAG: ferritin family protein [Candidatus Woesearchaeota archaeon]
MEEIIKAATRAEEQARDMYLRAKELATTGAQEELLQRLADEEQGHKERLESMDLQSGITHDSRIAESLSLTPLDEIADLKEILKIAMQREDTERETYIMLRDSCGSELREIFDQLASEEKGHKELLRKEFSLMFED